MKKKSLVIAASMVLAMTCLAGCSSPSGSKEDYQNDVKELAELKDVDTSQADMGDLMEDFRETIKRMDVITDEGKAVKENMNAYVEYVDEKMGDAQKFLAMDEAEITEVENKIEELCDELVDSMEEFKQDAKSTGVTDEEIQSVENMGMMGL